MRILMSCVVLAVCLSTVPAGGAPPADPSDPAAHPLPPHDRIPDIETFMQIGAAASPWISRDGERIYFTTSVTGTRQLFRITPEGWPYQLTFFPSGISDFVPSPDERTIAITAAPDGTERFQIYAIDAETGLRREITNEPERRFSPPVFAPDGRTIFYSANLDDAAQFHVYSQDLETGERKLVWKNDGINSPGDITDDGRYLLLYHTISNTRNEMYRMDLETGEVASLTPEGWSARFSAGAFSASGDRIYVVSDDNAEGIPRVGVIEGTPARLRPMFPDDRTPWAVESLSLSPDRSVLAWCVNEDGWGRLHIADAAAGRPLPVPDLDGIVSSPSLSDRGRIAFAYNSPVQTADVWTWDFDGKRGDPNRKAESGRLMQKTFSSYAGVDPSWFTPPRLIRYESFDGTRVPAFLYLPPGPRSGPIPFIFDVHGGPESQFRPYFNRHFQYLLIHGYGIVAPNVRGSRGYGRAYVEADDYKKRLDSVKDLAWGAKYLIEEGLSTPDRIGVKGSSYGGYMTLAALTEYPELFAAGIDEVGIANFETFLGGTAAYRRDLREAEYGPLEDTEFLRSISPIYKVDRIRGALLVVHGENDPRVPVGEARQILRALSSRGVPVDSLIFADEGHGVGKLPNRLVLYRRMVEFFDRHLRRGGQ